MYCNFKCVYVCISKFYFKITYVGPNPSKLGKSQNLKNPITCSQVKKNTELAKFVAQNEIGSLEPKRTVTVKEKVTKDNFENIFNKDKTNIIFQSDNISLEETLTDQFETARTSSLSDSNNWFNSNLETNSSIICGSVDQDETLKNETSYIDNEDISLLSSTIIPENTVEERTKINLSENSLTHKKICNHNSGDNSRDNEQIEQTVHNNSEENVNPIINATNTRSLRKFSAIIGK